MLVTQSIFLYELLESIRDDVLLYDIEKEHRSHFVRVGDVGLWIWVTQNNLKINHNPTHDPI